MVDAVQVERSGRRVGNSFWRILNSRGKKHKHREITKALILLRSGPESSARIEHLFRDPQTRRIHFDFDEDFSFSHGILE